MNEAIEMKTETIETVDNTVETVEEKPYTFRRLCGDDIFPMCSIIGKIGVNEFKSCFDEDGIAKLIESFMGEEKDGEKDSEKAIYSVGIGVALDLANTIVKNLPKCKEDIYTLLSQTSNLTEKQIAELDIAVFVEMVIDFIMKDDFKGFTKVASRFIK